MKYTDEQIKAAMSLCTDAKQPCKDCLLCDVGDSIDVCRHKLLCDALDLINRKEAEIERLEKRNEMLSNTRDSVLITHARELRRAKSEAIKEFADRLKEKASPYPYYQYGLIDAVSVEDIDNLVKMVGEQ